MRVKMGKMGKVLVSWVICNLVQVAFLGLDGLRP